MLRFAARVPATAWLVLYFGFIWTVASSWPPWGDEDHYLDVVRLFRGGLSLELLRTYPTELTAPVAFIAYSQWSRLIGPELWQLRLLSPILAIAMAALYDASLKRACRDAPRQLCLVTFVANPYVIGLSAFVFTDMLALCFLALALWGATTHRPWALAVGIAGATTTRQFLAFLAPALVLVTLARAYTGFARPWLWAVALSFSLVPLALLVVLWGGHLTPVNTARAVFLSEGWHFDLHALSLYLALPGIYLAPLVYGVLRRRPSRVAVAVGLVLSLLVLFWPIQPSRSQLVEGIDTVGFAHRAAVALLPPLGVRCLFWLSAWVWLVAMVESVRRWKSLASCEMANRLYCFSAVGVACFLAIMPFGHMPWEKYGLPMLLLAGAALAATIVPRDAQRATT